MINRIHFSIHLEGDLHPEGGGVGGLLLHVFFCLQVTGVYYNYKWGSF